jgi:hypothetical protein
MIDDLKEGDPVIVYKKIWMNDIPRKGIITKTFYSSLNNIPQTLIYQVSFYKDGKYISGCNIFKNHGETIELDIQENRNNKIWNILD